VQGLDAGKALEILRETAHDVSEQELGERPCEWCGGGYKPFEHFLSP
jgi:tRNA U54 and U55 pseudouridine synthase Pus10